MGVSKMDGLWWKIPLKWMIWGYPHFRKPSFICLLLLQQGAAPRSSVGSNAWWCSAQKERCILDILWSRKTGSDLKSILARFSNQTRRFKRYKQVVGLSNEIPSSSSLGITKNGEDFLLGDSIGTRIPPLQSHVHRSLTVSQQNEDFTRSIIAR